MFLQCFDGGDIWQLFNDVVHFFGMLFANIQQWSASEVVYERGAWIRVYGVPIHAWNDDCFRLCVLGLGRFLHTDECTVDKARFDYARILISTPTIEILNTSQVLLIDGAKFTIKMVEEWGYFLGEDAFLSKEVDDHVSEHLPHIDNDGFDEVQGEWELDELADDLQTDCCKHDGKMTADFNSAQKTSSVPIATYVQKLVKVCMEQQHNQVSHTVLQPVNDATAASGRVH